jgi:hypothetical protein
VNGALRDREVGISGLEMEVQDKLSAVISSSGVCNDDRSTKLHVRGCSMGTKGARESWKKVDVLSREL